MNDIAEVRACEERLRVAMLASDVPTLSGLMDDELVFTSPDGSVLNKTQDLSVHKSGLLKLTTIEFAEAAFHPVGDLLITTTKVKLSGSFDGATIGGSFAYTRIWARSSGEWRIVAGHAGQIG